MEKTNKSIRKIQKKIRWCKAQHNKYSSSNHELAKEYFHKISELNDKLYELQSPKAIVVYKQQKRKGIVMKKPKFKKKRIDHSVEFQKRKLNREMPMILRNVLYKYAKDKFDKKVAENEEIYMTRRLEVMFNLAKSI
tara:strand:- start:24 stop:434 length:411 start_codon:yes stop_codon:yes gene_type:complete